MGRHTKPSLSPDNFWRFGWKLDISYDGNVADSLHDINRFIMYEFCLTNYSEKSNVIWEARVSSIGTRNVRGSEPKTVCGQVSKISSTIFLQPFSMWIVSGFGLISLQMLAHFRSTWAGGSKESAGRKACRRGDADFFQVLLNEPSMRD